MKNVMRMSQMLTRIECLIGKKRKSNKKFKYLHQKHPPPFSKFAEFTANKFSVSEPSKILFRLYNNEYYGKISKIVIFFANKCLLKRVVLKKFTFHRNGLNDGQALITKPLCSGHFVVNVIFRSQFTLLPRTDVSIAGTLNKGDMRHLL